MSIIDFSQPISAILRESTKQAHQDVEHSPGAVALLNGQLQKEEYVRFLIVLWHVYDTFERALERHSAYPVLEPTYNPQLLARSSALSADISHLLQVPETTWRKHSIYISLKADPPPAMVAYISRIQEVSNSDPSRLLAHSYVRYLGDLSGGQSIKRVLAKSYGLDEASGEGLTFFAFRELSSSKAASHGEMKRIKRWFRAGMDKGVGDDLKVKDAVVEEANLVFSLNKAIFDSIDHSRSKEESLTREIVVQPPEDGGYSVASVASVIIAVGLAHFILVVAGFTGDRGYTKLVALFEEMEKLWKTVSR